MNRYLSILRTGVLFSIMSAVVACETTPPQGPKSSSTVAVQEGVPGGLIVRTVEHTGRVTRVERVTRHVTILDSDNKKFTVKAGPEVANLDRVYEGDMLKLTVTEEILVHLHEGTTPPPDTAAAAVVLAPKGAQPGAVTAATVRITGTVTAIDRAARTATLRFEDGSAKTFPVRSDIDLSKQRVGAKVTIQVTEMIAIRMERP